MAERTDYRGYVRATQWRAAKGQRAALLEAGVPLRAIYEDARGQLEAREPCIRALRAGDTLVVVGLCTLASSRQDAIHVLGQIRAKRAGLLCLESGTHFASPEAVAAIEEWGRATAEWAGMKYNPDRKLASAKGRKGAKAGVPRVERGMGEREARKVWNGAGSELQRLAAMPGWNKSAAYRKFGPRKK